MSLPTQPMAGPAVNGEADPASFRDPGGFVFRRDGVVYRQINPPAQADFELLLNSGLYEELTSRGQLLAHEEVALDQAATPAAVRVIRPRQLPFISYPYEWCFTQLQQAALLTLDAQLAALGRGLSLKDASAYNVQFVEGRPVLIDTLSFEAYPQGRPWVAYRQFCQHFLAPLALMSRVDVRLGQLLRVHLDGIPLDLASRLLPRRSKFSVALGLHIHAHARSQRKYADRPADAMSRAARRTFSRRSFEALLTSLRNAVLKQAWSAPTTEWADYYDANHNYGATGLDEKAAALRALLEPVRPKTVWDLGANTGRFSRVAAELGANVIAWDVDPGAVEAHWRLVREQGQRSVLPLLLDLTNPSPALGWANAERRSFLHRAPADLVLALGLIHHLAISNNVPLPRLAELLASLGERLVIEFVPKDDSQVLKLLTARADVFPTYHEDGFQAAFRQYFTIEQVRDVAGTKRTLYRMRRHQSP